MPYSHCVRCPTCDGFPCLVHAKSDAEVLGVRPALEHPNVTLLTNAMAVKLETNETGNEVTEVVVERDGETERFAGDLVVVACGAANSAKLLLASANDNHPNGLANGSDQVGRNYMFHDSVAVLALSHEPNTTIFQKTLGLNDFYFGSDDFEYPLGNIQMVGKSYAEMFRGERPGETKLAPGMDAGADGPPRGRLLALDRGPAAAGEPGHPRARRQHQVELLGDERERQEAALRQAQVDARPAGHALGPPVHPARLHEERHPGRRRARTRRARAGSETIRRRPCWTRDCRAHELDNLYVVDTSVFPSIGAVNPALTAMANSLRVGDHLLERMGASRLAATA